MVDEDGLIPTWKTFRFKSHFFAAIHSNPTYIPYFVTGFTNEMSFWQRAWNAYLKFSATVMMKVLGWHLTVKTTISLKRMIVL